MNQRIKDITAIREAYLKTVNKYVESEELDKFLTPIFNSHLKQYSNTELKFVRSYYERLG